MGNRPGGESSGGSYPMGDCPVGTCPNTKRTYKQRQKHNRLFSLSFIYVCTSTIHSNN